MNKGSTTVNKIAKYLREEITYSRLKSGQHLKESEISKEFNVSRVPVREAFRILQSEGYIDVIPNRGSFVKIITREYILEMALLYRLLVPAVLEKAIPKYNDKTYLKAEKILQKVEKCSDMNQIGYLLWDYAKVIYGPSKMKYILELYDDIYLHNLRSLNDVFEIKLKKHYDISPHKEFLKLCRENKINEAINHWGSYLVKIQQIMLKDKDKSKKKLKL